jgi:hypothetical protein
MSQRFGKRLLLGFIREVHRIDHANHGSVDGRIGAANGGHCGEAFGGEEDAFADARIHGVKRKDWIAAIGAIEVERLHDENFAPFVRGRLLCRDNITDDAAN